MSRYSQGSSKTIFAFIDESGNFDFKDSGTNHLVFAGFITSNPMATASSLHQLRYELMTEGLDLKYFHASEDRQFVRNQVFGSISTIEDAHAVVLYCDKRDVPESLCSDKKIHGVFITRMMEYLVRSPIIQGFDRVVMIFDQALPPFRQGVFHVGLKPQLKALGKTFHIFFQSVKVDMNGQIADYVAWAKFKQLERGENRPWESLMESLRPTEQNIFG